MVYPDHGTLLSLKKEVRTSATPWLDLKGIVLCGVSQTQKDRYRTIPLEQSACSSQIHRAAQWLGGARGGGRGQERRSTDADFRFRRRVVLMAAQLWKWISHHQTVYLNMGEMVTFMSFVFCHNF